MTEVKTITEKQEDRKRLDSLIEERDRNRERFLAAVEILHTKETKRELVDTFGIARKLTAEIHDLGNELRRDGIPNAEIIEEIQGLRERVQVLEGLIQEMKYLIVKHWPNPPE